MRNKLIALGTLAVALLGVIAFTTTRADAYRGDYTQVGPNHTQEREEEMNRIMIEGDYDAWVEFMTEDGRHPGVVDKISEEDFPAFVQAKELAQEGNLQEAQQIRSELGLGNGEGNQNRHRYTEMEQNSGETRSAKFTNCNKAE